MSEPENHKPGPELKVIDETGTEKDIPEVPELTPVIGTVDKPQQLAPAIAITLGDLEQIVKVIDTVSQRGAFRGEELQPVGRLRDHIVNYINQNLQEAG